MPLIHKSAAAVTPEATIERKSCRWAAAQGFVNVKMSMGQGWPDRMFIGHGLIIFVEFKRPGKHPTDLQLERMKTIRDNGGHAYWTDSVEAFKLIMNGLRK